MSQRSWIVFEPLDVITVRDGRPFEANTLTQGTTREFPIPYTFAGACAAAVGGGSGRNDAAAGPILSIDGTLWFPTPLDIVAEPDDPTPRRLQFTEGDVATDLDSPMLAFGDGDPVGGWVSTSGLNRYLSDHQQSTGGVRSSEQVVNRHVRTGLQRKDRKAAEGLLYTNEYLEPAGEDVGFAGWVYRPDPVQVRQPVVRFGGESRLAAVRLIDAPPAPALPEPLGRRLVVYFATPAVLPAGSQFPPSVPVNGRERDVVTLGSVVRGPVPITGWGRGRDGSPRPRHLDWGIAAGSIYVVEFPDDELAHTWAIAQHGRCFRPQHQRRQRSAGFGLCYIGRAS